MKVLCLHGFGTSGAIMERQFAPFLSALGDDSYEYVYLDGDLETTRPKEISESIAGPYLAYFDSFSFKNIQDACEQVEGAIEDDGPFDGVVAFSHGASVVMSYLLNYQINNPKKALPFKWAVFFSCVAAFSPDPNYLDKEIKKYSKHIDKSDFLPTGEIDVDAKEPEEIKSKKRIALVLDRNKRALAEELKEISRAVRLSVGDYVDTTDMDERMRDENVSVSELPRIYHPTLLKEKLSLPCVHVAGKADSPYMLTQSKLSAKLTDHAIYIEHSGGHDIPRHPQELGQAVSAVDGMIKKSQMPGFRLPGFNRKF